MVAIVGGNGLGLQNSSANVLGASGQFGLGTSGTNRESAFINVATGNLVLDDRDDWLPSSGLNLALTRSYNSLGSLNNGAGLNWSNGGLKSISGLTGTINTAGSTVVRTDSDGSTRLYTYDATLNAYRSTDGAGTYDTLVGDNRGWTWFDGTTRSEGVFERYDSNGRIAALGKDGVDRVTYGFDSAGRIATITDGSGDVTHYEYENGALARVRTDLAGGGSRVRTSYVYDSLKRLTAVNVDMSPEDGSVADGKVYSTTYTYYGNSAQVQSVTQADGSALSFEYDAGGRVSRVTDALQRSTAFDYSRPGQTAVTDPLGNVVVYAYDANKQLTAVTTTGSDGKPLTTSYYYDSKGNLERVVSAAGRATNYAYDANGNRVLERDADGRTISRVYDSDNALVSETVYGVADPDGSGPGAPTQPMTRRFYYDANGYLRFEQSPNGSVTEYRYNGQHQVEAKLQYSTLRAGADGDTYATLVAWADASKASIVARTDLRYDGRGQLSTSTAYTAVKDGAGVANTSTTVLHYAYDISGRLIKTIDDAGHATAFSYDELGRELTRSDANGVVTSTEYDDAGGKLRVKVETNGGRDLLSVTQYVLDRAGQITTTFQEHDGQSSGTTTYVYDKDGRLRMTQDSAGNVSHVLYDASGRKAAEIVNRSMIEYFYDADGLLTGTVRYAADIDTALLVAPDGTALSPLLSDLRPTTLKEANRRTWNGYDAAGRVTASVDANGYLTRLEYDGAGRLVATIARSKAVDTALIVNGAIPKQFGDEAQAGDRISRLFYDADGNTIARMDARGFMTEYVYDGAGRLADTISYRNAVAEALRASASLADLWKSTGADGIHQRNLYDGKGQLVGVVDAGDFLTEISYDAAGNVTSRRRYATAVSTPDAGTLAALGIQRSAADRETLYSYNAANQLISERTPATGEVIRYGYDDAGRQTSVERGTLTSAELVSLRRYDGIGQLIGELSAEGAARLAQLGPQPDATDVSKVWAQYGMAYAYDAQGHRISATDQLGHRTLYVYDHGRLAALINAAGDWESYRYDAFGDLIEVSRHMVALDADQLQLIATTHNVGSLPSAGAALITKYYYDNDGRRVYVANADGAVQKTEYDAFDQTIRTIQYLTPLSQVSAAIGNQGHVSGAQTDLNAALTGSAGIVATRRYYDAVGNLIYTVDANNAVEGRTYDGRGRILTTTQYGQQVTVSGGSADLAALARLDASGNNRTQTFAYDGRGLATSLTDAMGYRTTNRYDAFGALTETTSFTRPDTAMPNSLDIVVQTLYDAAGRVRATVSATGSVTALTYDSNGRILEQVTYAIPAKPGVTPQEILAALGDGSLSDLAHDLRQRFVYDRDGRLVAALTLQHDGKTPTADGRVTVDWRITAQDFDKAGNLVQRRGFASAFNSGLEPTAQSVIDWIGDASHADEADTAVRYAYDADGRVIATATALRGSGATREWAVEQVVYDGAGRVAQRIARVTPLLGAAPDGDAMAKVGAPTAGATGADAITYYRYDAMGRVVATAKALGAAGATSQWSLTERTYDAAGNVLSVRDYVTPLVDVRPDSVLQPVVQDTRDRLTRYSYDAAGRLVTTVGPDGAATHLDYDARGNVIRVTQYAARVEGTAQLAANFVPANSAGDRITSTFYDLNNRPVYQVDAEGSVLQRRFDTMGNVVASVAFATRLFQSTVAALAGAGDIERLMQANTTSNDRATYFAYYPDGRLRYAIDAGGYVTEKQYDAAGRVIAELAFAKPIAVPTDASANDIVGLGWTAAVAQAGNDTTRVTRYAYDAGGNLQTVTDALGQKETYAYDALGRKISFTNKLGNTWHYGYDAAGRLIKETSPAVTVYADPMAAVVGNWGPTTTQALITAMEYDALGNLIKRTEASNVPGKERITEYRYDAAGRQVQTILPAVNVYAPADDTGWNGEHPVTEKSSGPRTVTVVYDALGNAIANTDVGGKTSYKVYDRSGAVAWEIDAAGFVTGYARNAFGEVDRMTRYASAWTDGTDALLTISADTFGTRFATIGQSAEDRTIRYTRDAKGRVLTATEPMVAVYDQHSTTGAAQLNAARTTANTYNAFGEVTRQAVYGADGAGKRVTDASATQFYYNTRGEKVAQVAVLSESPGQKQGYLTTYQYDAAGNLLDVAEYAQAYGTWTDDSYVGVAASSADRVVHYRYDKLDRKRSETRDQVSYVAAGALIETRGDLVTQFAYDALGNQTAVTDATGHTTRTYYDSLGRVTGTAREQDPAPATKQVAAKLTEFKLDVHGNIVMTVEYASAWTPGESVSEAMTRDAANRITVSRFDVWGRLLESRDAEQFATDRKTVRSSYDVYGRLAKQWRTVHDTTGAVTTSYQVIGYDALGNVTAVTTPGLLRVDGSVGKPNTKVSEYNAFGEVTGSSILTDGQVVEGSKIETHYDAAGHAWRSNADGGVWKVSLFDVHGNVTATVTSTAAHRDGVADAFASLTSTDGILARLDTIRTENRYDLLGHLVDSRVLDDARLTVLVREAGQWVQKTIAPDGALPSALIVIGDATETPLATGVRYRRNGGEWQTADATRVRTLAGKQVFDTTGMAAGNYEYDVVLQPKEGRSYSRLGGALAITSMVDGDRDKQIIAMFLMLYNRAPDLASINFWIDSSNKGVDLAGMFAASLADREWQAGAPASASEIVGRIFRNAFGTAALPAGAQPEVLALWADRWTRAAAAEAPGSTVQRGQLLADLLDTARAENGAAYRVLDARTTALENYLVQQHGSDMALADALKVQAGTDLAGAMARGTDLGSIERQQVQLIELYIAMFGRAPDAAGLESWRKAVASGVRLDAVAASMLASDEAQRPWLYPVEGLTSQQYNEQLVDRAYTLSLGRPPAASERSAWLAKLNDGTLSRGQFVVAFVEDTVKYDGTDDARVAQRNLFSNKVAVAYTAVVKLNSTFSSTEAAAAALAGVTSAATAQEAAEKALLAANTAAELARNAHSAADIAAGATPFEDIRLRLTRLYVVLLGRLPDKAGLESYIPASPQTQVAWSTVAKEFLSSTEAKTVLGDWTTMDNATFVRKLYANALGTVPGGRLAQAEIAGFVARLASGASRYDVAVDIAATMLNAPGLSADEQAARALLDNKTAVGLTAGMSLVLVDAAAQRETLARVTSTDYAAALDYAYGASQSALTAKLKQLTASATAAASLADALASSASATADAQAAGTALAANAAAQYRLQLTQLYVTLLGRSATSPVDVAGIQFYVQQNFPLATVADKFVTSTEGAVLYPAGLGNSAFVDAVVKQVLGDAANVPTDVRAGWAAQLSASPAPTRGKMALDIATAILNNSIGNGSTSAAYVNARSALLQRVADATTKLDADTATLIAQLQSTLHTLQGKIDQLTKDVGTLEGTMNSTETARGNAVSAANTALSNADVYGDRLATKRLLAVRLYATLLSRSTAPKLNEIAYQMQFPPESMAQGMMNDNPAIFPTNATSAQLVNTLYLKILGRNAEPPEITHYVDWLTQNAGKANYKGLLAVEILTNFANYTDNTASALTNKKTFDEKIAGFLATINAEAQKASDDANAVYVEAKRRKDDYDYWLTEQPAAVTAEKEAATAKTDGEYMLAAAQATVRRKVVTYGVLFQGGLTYAGYLTWMRKLQGGATDDAFVSDLTANYPSDTTLFVKQLYSKVLGRPGDLKAEINYYVNQINTKAMTRTGVAKEIVTSVEATRDRYGKVIDPYENGVKNTASYNVGAYPAAKSRLDAANKYLPLARDAYNNNIKPDAAWTSYAAAYGVYASLTQLIEANKSVIAADSAYIAAVNAKDTWTAKKAERDVAVQALADANTSIAQYQASAKLGAATIAAANAFAKAAAAAAKVLVLSTASNVQMQTLAQVYVAVLNRAPTAVELYMATDRLSGGAGMAALVESLINSNPGQYPSGQTPTAFVTQLFSNGLGRSNDTAGIKYYTDQMAAGVSRGDIVLRFLNGINTGNNTDTLSFNNRTRSLLQQLGATEITAQDADAIIQSGADQVRQRAAAYDAAAAAALAGSADGQRMLQLTRLYVTVLGRTPDTAGLRYYVDLMRRNPTLTLDTVAQEMMKDAEGQRAYPAALSSAEFVTAVFRRAMGRSPTTTELNDYVNQLASRSRGQVLSTIVNAVVSYSGTDALLRTTQLNFNAKVSAALSQVAAQAAVEDRAAVSAVDVLKQTVATGVQTAYLRDEVTALGTVRTGHQALASPNRITVDRWGNVLSVTDLRDPRFRITYQYNQDNQMVAQSLNALETATDVAQRRTRYDALGRVAAQVDFMGNVNGVSYDSNGNVIREYHADGGVVTSTYNLFGNRLSVQQPTTTLANGEQREGVLTAYSYDRLGRLTESRTGKAVDVWVAPLVGTEYYPVEYRDAQILKQTYSYDELGRRLIATDADGVKSLADYDADGNVIRTQTLSAERGYEYKVLTAYDALHRKVKTLDALGSSMTWEYKGGLLSSHTDMGGLTTTYRYDQTGRLLHQGTDNEGRKQDLTYAYQGVNLVQIDDGYNRMATKYTYDAAGNRLTEDQVYASDAPRSPSRVLHNTLVYDMENRLTHVNDDLMQVDYTYDNNGNRMTITTQYGSGPALKAYNWYDAMNRQTIVNGTLEGEGENAKVVFGGQGHQITYDLSGNRLTDKSIGKKVVFEGGRYLTRDGQETIESYTYDEAGRLATVSRDGLEVDYRRYDAAGRISQSGLRWTGASGVDTVLKDLGLTAGRIYSYDAGGHITRQRDLTIKLGKAQDTFFVMDDKNPNGGYDAMGNLKGYSVSRTGVSMKENGYYSIEYVLADTYKEAWTTLKGHGTTDSEYDANGNRTRIVERGTGKVLNELWYDAEGHIQSYHAAGQDEKFNLIVNGNVLGEENGQPTNFMGSTYVPVNSPSLSAPPSTYTVESATETLHDIAQSVWGDANLWYVIADANGLAGDAKLEVGQTLHIPAKINTVHGDYNTFKPYDPTEQIGSTAPALPEPGKGGCGAMGTIVMIVVAVVATIVTAGAAAVALGAVATGTSVVGAGLAVMTGELALSASVVAAAAVGGAVGSIASQAVGIAIGAQDGFNWKGVALSAIGSGIGAGVASAAGGMGGVFAQAGPAGAAARAALGNVLAQGVGNVTGLQKGFNWRSTVASAIGAAAGNQAGAMLKAGGALDGLFGGNAFANSVASGFVGGLSTAVARGGKIEVARIATDAFGNTLAAGLLARALPESELSVDSAQPNGESFEDGYQKRLGSNPVASWLNKQSRAQVAAEVLANEGVDDINSSSTSALGAAQTARLRLSSEQSFLYAGLGYDYQSVGVDSGGMQQVTRRTHLGPDEYLRSAQDSVSQFVTEMDDIASEAGSSTGTRIYAAVTYGVRKIAGDTINGLIGIPRLFTSNTMAPSLVGAATNPRRAVNSVITQFNQLPIQDKLVSGLEAALPLKDGIHSLAAKIPRMGRYIASDLSYTSGTGLTFTPVEKPIVGQSGARELSLREMERQEAEAIRMYGDIRASNTDVKSIARNTGIQEFQIARVKNHLFYDDTHQLRYGAGRFDPDFEIAEAWNRMEIGEHTSLDIQLLKHEYFESRFEKIFRTDYSTAHNKTQLRYPSPLN